MIEIITMVILKAILILLCSLLATTSVPLGIFAVKEDEIFEGLLCFALALLILALIPVIIFVM